jgi:hypothetical protein
MAFSGLLIDRAALYLCGTAGVPAYARRLQRPVLSGPGPGRLLRVGRLLMNGSFGGPVLLVGRISEEVLALVYFLDYVFSGDYSHQLFLFSLYNRDSSKVVIDKAIADVDQVVLYVETDDIACHELVDFSRSAADVVKQLHNVFFGDNTYQLLFAVDHRQSGNIVFHDDFYGFLNRSIPVNGYYIVCHNVLDIEHTCFSSFEFAESRS